MDFGWYGDRDVAGAVRFVQRLPDAAGGRVLAVGLSMGGEEAVGALPAVPDLCAVVAEGATARTAADKSWLSDAYGVRGWVQEGLDRLQFGVTDLLTSASSPRSLRSAVTAGAPRRVLLIAAGREADEAKAAAYIESGAPDAVTVWVAPGAGHTGVLDSAPRGVDPAGRRLPGPSPLLRSLRFAVAMCTVVKGARRVARSASSRGMAFASG